jgi:hypothetical protein
VPGGVELREAQLIMEMVADTGRMGSLDLVEVNPALDKLVRPRGCRRPGGKPVRQVDPDARLSWRMGAGSSAVWRIGRECTPASLPDAVSSRPWAGDGGPARKSANP